MRYYADSNGVCIACGTNFHSRLRLLAHLVDKRRPKCRDQILFGNFHKNCHEKVLKLDIEDRVARRAAKQQGHTHAIAVGSATRADGSLIGRVSA